MSSFLTLISSLPFIIVFSALLITYFIPTSSPSRPLIPRNPPPPKSLRLAESHPTPTNPPPRRPLTLSPSNIDQPRKLISHLANTVASTPTCITASPHSTTRPAPHRPEQPTTTMKKKKPPNTVSFALEHNTTQVVDRWIKRVSWAPYDEVAEVQRWIEPHGRRQLHFPRTVFIRDGPDTEAVDDEGDAEMVDA
ncbi:hypothetical protein BDR22DRAFT_890455 [Usnea florida]